MYKYKQPIDDTDGVYSGPYVARPFKAVSFVPGPFEAGPFETGRFVDVLFRAVTPLSYYAETMTAGTFGTLRGTLPMGNIV
jgi:hypothetical protein